MKATFTVIVSLFVFTVFSQSQKNHTFFLNDGTKLVCKDVTRRINKQYLEIDYEDGSTFNLYFKDFYRYEYDMKKCGICKDYVHQVYEVFNFDGQIIFEYLYADGNCKLISTSYGVGGYGGGLKYYVIRENEDLPTQIGTTGLISKNYKQVALEYFSDCEKMDLKIKKRFKKNRKRLTEVVDFYNKNCAKQ